jgi:membrane protein DedA with SNARE-associated domain
LLANAAGAILWAGVFGIGAYYFGKLLFELHAVLATAMFVVALVIFFGAGYLISRYEHRLIEVAEEALPGPLQTSAKLGSR